MRFAGSATIIVGLADTEHDYNPHLVDDTSMHVKLAPNTTMIAADPARLHHLADVLKGAAEEWDKIEANNADIDHSLAPVVLWGKEDDDPEPFTEVGQ